MSIKSIFGLAAVGMVFLSCQSTSYHINGFARDFHDGDTIWIAWDDTPYHPFDMAIISAGKFQFDGNTDSTALCRIFTKQPAEEDFLFFLEADDITVELSPVVGSSRVSGTRINNEWQLLTDSIHIMGQEAVKALRTPVTDSVGHLKKLHTVDSLHHRMSSYIEQTGHRNHGNALGQYIETHYKTPEFK